MATNWPNSVQTFTNPTSGSALNSPSHADQHATVNDTVEALQTYAGLVFIKLQTIGSGVSSVTVTDAFSSTFRNYRIILDSADASTITSLNFELGTGSPAHASGYYGVSSGRSFISGVTNTNYNNTSPMPCATTSTGNATNSAIEVYSPQGGAPTQFSCLSGAARGTLTTGNYGDGTSFTAFTLKMTSGTLTGGTIRVYGYNNGA